MRAARLVTEVAVDQLGDGETPLTAVSSCHDRLITGYHDGSVAVWKAHHCGPDIKQYLVSNFGGRR